jgi:hypothetical protein
MKNEVKKKMHEVEQALLYQSHRETRVKEKNLNVAPSKHVASTHRRERMKQRQSAVHASIFRARVIALRCNGSAEVHRFPSFSTTVHL